jgi:HAE1 family hydrophobic/amphiphilic exporter-1
MQINKVNSLFQKGFNNLTHLFLMFVFGLVLAVVAAGQTTQPTMPQPSQPVPSPNATPPQNPIVQPDNAPSQQPTEPNTPADSGAANPAPTAAGQDVGTSGGVAPAQLPEEPPAIEPNFEAPVRELPSAERVGVDVSQQTPLSLNEAITMALENNNNIETAQIDVQQAEFDLTAARGVFDPRLSTQSFFERSEIPTASSLGGANGSTTSTSFSGNVGINGFSPIAGGSYQTSFNSQRQTTNNPFTSLNPQFPTSFNLSYTQPLWRGLRIDDNRRRIQIAKKNLSLTDAQFRQQSINTITNVVQAYWDLAYALRNLQVQIDAVKQAREQVESNRRQVQEGYLAPVDIIAADTQVTNFEQNVYAAQEQVTRAESNLKTLILPRAEADLWARAVVPTTPVNVEPPRTSFQEALSTAITTRPEIAQLQTTKEINDINTRYFRDQTKPRVDLVASYTGAGLAGTQVTGGTNPLTSTFGPIVDRVNQLSALNDLPPLPGNNNNNNSSALPGNLIGGYGQSIQNIAGFNYPTYRVGVNIELPFGNRTAKANLGRSLAENNRIEALRDQTEQQIKFEVQTSLQSLRSAEARLASAAASRSSAEQLYQSEQRRLQNGTSTVYFVLQRQQELVAARARELQAQTDLNKAIANFQRSTGNTFQAHNISVQDGGETATKLQITNPAPSDTDDTGHLPSQKRETPSISGAAAAKALGAQPE